MTIGTHISRENHIEITISTTYSFFVYYYFHAEYFCPVIRQCRNTLSSSTPFSSHSFVVFDVCFVIALSLHVLFWTSVSISIRSMRLNFDDCAKNRLHSTINKCVIPLVFYKQNWTAVKFMHTPIVHTAHSKNQCVMWLTNARHTKSISV